METRWALAVAVVGVVLVVVEEKGAEAKEVWVGNEAGWTNYDVRRLEVPDYGAWASSQKVVVGDQVGFKYARGLHNVNLLPDRSAYESCDFSRATLLDAGGSGVFVWRALRDGVYYFGCNKEVAEEGNHCGSGQKMRLVVLKKAAEAQELTSMAPAPASAAIPLPPPPGKDFGVRSTSQDLSISRVSFLMLVFVLLLL